MGFPGVDHRWREGVLAHARPQIPTSLPYPATNGKLFYRLKPGHIRSLHYMHVSYYPNQLRSAPQARGMCRVKGPEWPGDERHGFVSFPCELPLLLFLNFRSIP